MIRSMMIGLALAALAATPALAAQEQTGAPIEASAAAPAPMAAQAAPPAPARAKRSLAEKLAVAAGVLGAGVAAYSLLKPGAGSAAPSPAAAPVQTAAQ